MKVLKRILLVLKWILAALSAFCGIIILIIPGEGSQGLPVIWYVLVILFFGFPYTLIFLNILKVLKEYRKGS